MDVNKKPAVLSVINKALPNSKFLSVTVTLTLTYIPEKDAVMRKGV